MEPGMYLYFFKAAPSPYLLGQSSSGTVHTMNLTHVWLIMHPRIINCADTHTIFCLKGKKSRLVSFSGLSCEWFQWSGVKSERSGERSGATLSGLESLLCERRVVIITTALCSYTLNRTELPWHQRERKNLQLRQENYKTSLWFCSVPRNYCIVARWFSNWLCCAPLRCVVKLINLLFFGVSVYLFVFSWV